ncbi:tape measure protein [Ornithinibacillus sp. JPR2-1]|uniref:tape measure protein n=1 Tax=Ornithinibacillus sp. JPR2-1 TaxID=2094019 RepID=UPI0031D5A9E8
METYSVEAYLKAVGVDQFAKAFQNATNSLQGVDKTSKKTSLSVGSLVKTIAGVAATVGIFATLRSAVGKAFDRIDTMEQFERVMTVMTGSASKANKVLEETSDIVTGTAYGLDVAASSVQGFVTSNMDVDKATESVARWGDAVAFYGDGSNETFNSVTTALAQMTAKGKVQMDTMNRLAEAGIPAMQIYADATGKSVEKVAAQMQKGELRADEFMDVMNAALKNGTANFGAIEGAAKEAGASWSGSFANMRAATARGVIAIIEAIDKLLTDNGLEDMRGMIANFGSFMENTLKNAAKVIEPVGNAFFALIGYIKPLIPLILGLATGFGTFFAITKVASVFSIAGSFAFLKGTLDTVAPSFMHLWSAMKANPIIAIISILVGLATMIVYLWKTNETFREIVLSVWGAIKSAFEGLMPVISTVGAFFVSLGEGIRSFVDSLATGTVNAFNSAMEWLGDIVQNVSGFFQRFKESAGVEGVFSALIGPLKTIGLLLLGVSGPIGWLISGLTFLATRTNIFTDMLKVFKGEMDFGDAIDNAAEMSVGFINNLSKMLVSAIEIGSDIVVEFIKGLSKSLPSLVQKGTEILTKFIDSIVQALPGLIEAGVSALTTLIDGIVLALPSIIEAGIEIIQTLVETFTSLLPMLIEVGITILMTLINAWMDMLPMLIGVGIMILTTLVDVFIENLPLIIDAAITILTTLLNVLIENLPLIIDAGIQLLTALIDGLIEVIPALIEAGIEILMALIDTFVELLPTIIDAGIEILMALIEGLIDSIPSLLQAGLEIIIALAGALIEALPQIFEAAVKIVWELIKGIGSVLYKVVAAGWDLIKSLASGIWEKTKEVANAAKDVVTDGVDAVKKKVDDFVSAGKDLIAGMIKGIGQKARDLADSALNAAKDAVNGVLGFLGIKSPSRLFMGIGDDTMAGYIIGIDKMKRGVQKSMIGIASTASDAINGNLPVIDIAGKVNGIQAQSQRQMRFEYANEMTISREPAHITVKIGNSEFNAFVDDISNVQDRKAYRKRKLSR